MSDIKRINLHAGHNPDGSVSCGAIGLIKESTEIRKVVVELTKILTSEGIKVFDCTVNNGTSTSDVINKILAKSNANNVDLNVSIHFNSARNDLKGDGKTGGVEVLVYDKTGIKYKVAERICESVSKLGYTNRGVKVRTNLGVLKGKGQSLLVECCFVDDKDDIKLYNPKSMAQAIAEGILGRKININKGYSNGTYNRKAITTANLNVRSGRGTEYNIIATIPKGTELMVNYCLNNWFSTYDVGSSLGYVHGDYIKLI